MEFDDLVSTPPFSDVPPSLSIGATRITLAPDGVLDIDYGGPAIYLVESGEVMVSYQMNAGMVLLDATQSDEGARRTDKDRDRDRDRKRDRDSSRGGVVLGPGQAISANYGNLGRTTNVGDGPATVLAIVTAPYVEGDYESESYMVTAEPEPTKAP